MIERILVAIDDSAPALAALDVAIDLATAIGAELGVTTVPEPGRNLEAIRRHASRVAVGAGLDVLEVTTSPSTSVFETILATAADWRADLVVIGRSDRRPSGRAYVGSQTEHLLEFTQVPVVVVPG